MSSIILQGLSSEQLQTMIETAVNNAIKHLQQPHHPTEPIEHFLNVQQTADFLNLSVPTIYSKVSRGELPYMKQGKRLYFSSKELTAYLKDGRRLTNDEIVQEAESYLINRKK